MRYIVHIYCMYKIGYSCFWLVQLGCILQITSSFIRPCKKPLFSWPLACI